MEADIQSLFSSDVYRILNFRCRCRDCNTSKPEYAHAFCISFIRKGNFLFNVFRNSFDSHTGRLLVTKPGYEHTVTHINREPDECTIIEFRQSFYEGLTEYYGKQATGFLMNKDVHSLLLATTTETEYLHHAILSRCFQYRPSRLEMDQLVMELVHGIMQSITGVPMIERVSEKLKNNHLQTIERAKDYLADHFKDDISLQTLANHCFVSPFHFSRLFKTFTSYSPHQFLLHTRLKHAEMLLKTGMLPVVEICFSAGFNSLENFSASFRQKYQVSPSRYRLAHGICDPEPISKF